MLVRPLSSRTLPSSQAQRHHAICADCSASTTVPFLPTQGKPVYCSACFKARRRGPSSTAKTPVSEQFAAVDDHPVDNSPDNARLENLSRGERFENRLYRELLALGETNKDEILARFPRIIRRVSGYNLDELVANNGSYGAGYSSRTGPFNLAKLLVGSEGTLAVLNEVKIRVVPLPQKKALLLVHFRSLRESVESVEEILSFEPAAVELMDEFILKQAFSKPEFAAEMGFVDRDAKVLMVVEFHGDSETELQSKLDTLKGKLQRTGIGFGYLPVVDRVQQQSIWNTRKQALGLLMSVPGDKKPIAFVEDPAVPIEKMPAFLRGFQSILETHDAQGGYYGHASVGCLHVRPMINLKQASEVAKMGRILDEVFALVKEYGGSMSGEHGDGIARGKYNKELFGPEIYQAFRKVKALFDPHNIMNPGKVVEAPEPVEDLRWGAGYRTIDINTHLDFSRQGGFARAIEQCNGMGVCRKRDVGTMCPSYHATLEEEHSTRGRANALRAALSGTLPPGEFTSKRMYDVLDLCLECKGCKRECPTNVDMAKIKYEFLAHYYAEHGTPLRARMFAGISKLNKWGSRFAPLSNLTMRLRPVKWALDRFVGIDARRAMPPFAGEDFETWFTRRKAPTASSGKSKVVLFHDCFMSYNYPDVGKAATELLEKAGFEGRAGREDLLRPPDDLKRSDRRRPRGRRAQRACSHALCRARDPGGGLRAKLLAHLARRLPRPGEGTRRREGRRERADGR